MKKPEIDFVITWVDGSDIAWQKERSLYPGDSISSDAANGMVRYRDWELLRFWFRAVERFAPWVRYIYFVTWGHVPKWLNTSHPKLIVVKHEDYIPAQYLPTFNSNTIELHLHRLPGLSEQFVYFNDDMFLLRPVKSSDFFTEGKPMDMLALQPVVANREDHLMPYIFLNNAMVLARHFEKRQNMKEQPKAYLYAGYPLLYRCYNLLEMLFPRFTGFYTVHGPSPFQKSTFETLWQLEWECMDRTCQHRFRSKEDVSQYLLRGWQMLCGNFLPYKTDKLLRYFDIGTDNQKLLRTIAHQKSAVICINDSSTVADISTVKQEIQLAFEKLLPEKSSFEAEK